MSANTDALKTAILAELDKLADGIGKAEARVLCDRYIAAVEGQTAVESGAVQSYTIAGRTVTRRNLADGSSAINSLRRQLMAYVNGQVSVVDMGGWA